MMNASATNQGIATSSSVEIELKLEEKGGAADLESQQEITNATGTVDSNSTSSGDSANRLVAAAAGTDVPKFIEPAPPTLKETAACIGFCVVGTALAGVSTFVMEAHKRPMPVQYLESSGEYVRNLTNNETYKGETVDTIALMLLCVFVPGCIQATYGCVRGSGKGDFFRAICTYTVAFTITGIVTEFIKNYVGYLRPIFFHQCSPDDQYQICNGLGWYENDLHKSFVSGHASFAFCGGVLFSLFLERIIGVSSIQVAVARHLMPPQQGEAILPLHQSTSIMMVATAYRQPPGWRKVGSIVSLLPMIISVWVACSRIVDNVHFPADVVGGSVLGATIAAYCHPLWYPDPRFLA